MQDNYKHRNSSSSSVLIKIAFISLIFLVIQPAHASLLGFQLNFNVVSGSTTLGGKTIDSDNPFTAAFIFDSDDIIQPLTTVGVNQFSMDFSIGGMEFSALNTLGTIQIQKLFGTGPNDITRLQNGLVTFNNNANEFVSFTNTGSPPNFFAGNGSSSAFGNYTITSLGTVPIPAAVYLFLTGLSGLFVIRKKFFG